MPQVVQTCLASRCVSTMCSSSGKSYFSAKIETTSEVCGMVDSPTAKRGCWSASIMTTLAPFLPRIVPSMEPERPLPRIATSKLCFVSCITIGYFQLLELNQRSSPRKASTICCEHNKVAIFNASSFERIHVANNHVGFLQVAVMHAGA